MEHANKSLVAVQGADSLRVDVSDVLKYPESFLALCMSSEFVEKDKDGAIIVKDRDAKCFPLVEKYYKSGKVKVLDAGMNLEDVRKELSFWFPGSTIDIFYKDLLAHFDYVQGHKIAAFFKTEGERLRKEILARATEGYEDYTRILDSALMREKKTVLLQHQKLYKKLVINLFPDSECVVSFNGKPTGPQYPLIISWKLGVGSLGKVTEAGFKTKSKFLIRRVLAEAAEEFYKGSCSVSMFEVFDDKIPFHFPYYLVNYALSKSDSQLHLTRDGIFICWDFTSRLV